MKKILILEKTGEELVSAGYTKCTLEKYNQYKADTTNYQTAISDGGKYYFKKKKETAAPTEPRPTEPRPTEPKADEKPYLTVKLPFTKTLHNSCTSVGNKSSNTSKPSLIIKSIIDLVSHPKVI